MSGHNRWSADDAIGCAVIVATFVAFVVVGFYRQPVVGAECSRAALSLAEAVEMFRGER